jgi:hypothetical protein
MTSRRAFLFRFTLLIATVILAMPAHRSPAADTDQDPFSMHAPVPLIGRWDVTVEGPDGSYPSWFEVQQSGYRTLVGSYVGQFGAAAQ